MPRRITLNKVLGIILVALGILVNQWTLLWLFPRPDGNISLDSKILVWLFQIGCLALGALLFFRGNTREQRKKLLFGFIMICVMVIFIEAGLQIADTVFHFGEFPVNEFQYTLSPYDGKPWARQLFKECSEVTKQFEQYVCWDTKPYDGRYVNIDRTGMRATWNPDSYAEPPDTVYMFGGSTVWGWGARDEHTVPSYVSRLLNEREPRFVVFNYGKHAYTFTQGLVQFIVLLQEGHRPDYVIFYDGINDVYGTYQAGHPGSIHNVAKIRKQLQSKSLPRVIWDRITGWFEHQCMAYKALTMISVALTEQRQYQELTAQLSDEQMHALGDGTAHYYLRSLDLLHRLSQQYGFNYSCFWQPTTFSEEELIGDESTADPRAHDPALRMLYRTATETLERAAPPRFNCITDALKDRTEAMYIDMCHLSERGNEIIAGRIYDRLIKEYSLQLDIHPPTEDFPQIE